MQLAVLGSPIKHSLSPALHRAAYAALGLNWQYQAIEVTAAELAKFIASLDESWRGLSLTMPLKRVVLPLLAETSELAAMVGAANTIWQTESGWVGDNTDVTGAIAALKRQQISAKSAVIWGGGATAASLVMALTQLKCNDIEVWVRSASRAAADLAPEQQFNLQEKLLFPEPISADLVISTIPASAQTPELLATVPRNCAIFEVVYDPWPTPLQKLALTRNQKLVTGLDLLLSQAAQQVEIFTGLTAPVEIMRQALPNLA